MTPPVLICPGMADTVRTWQTVTELLAGRHRVVDCDRPGLGLAEPLRELPTLAGEAARIAAVVDRATGRAGRTDRHRRGGASRTGPVLVAHSVAALYAEAYARRHPDRLAGLVLVDPSVVRSDPSVVPSDPAGRGPARAPDLAGRLVVRAAPALARAVDASGLARLAGPALWAAAVRSMTGRPPPERLRVRAGSLYGTGRVAVAALAEWLAYDGMLVDLARLRRRTAPPPVPVVVLTALGDLRSPGQRARWRIAHDRLAASFPGGRQEVLRDCGHLVQLERPDAVAAAVRELTGGGDTLG